MTSVARKLNVAAYLAKLRLADWRRRARTRLALGDPHRVLPYRGLGTRERLVLRGRVLEDRGIQPPAPDDGRLDNARRIVRHFLAEELPGARVRARLEVGGADAPEQVAVTDEAGYFEVALEPRGLLDATRAWHGIELELLDPPRADGPVRARGEVLVPLPSARLLVVSDLDDTVVVTGATRWLRKLRTVLANNAHTRKPFAGVAAFYGALARGPRDAPRAGDSAGADDAGPNPIVYLSSSPWNLYDVLAGFLEVHGLPPGPLVLKEIGLSRTHWYKPSHASHKRAHVERLLALWPHLPVLLIGDTGQHDAEIYRRIALEHPGRVLAIYLREVAARPRRERLNAIAAELGQSEHGVDVIVAPDTLAAARHAAERGWIDASALAEIGAERRAEEAPDG